MYNFKQSPKISHTARTGGFTLVETLVSVLMIAMVLVAISTLMNRALGAITSGKEFFIASKLAIEGLEYVRVKRNNNLIAMGTNPSIKWNTGMGNGTYSIDATNLNRLKPGQSLGGEGGTLCTNTSGQYTHSGCNTENKLQGDFTRRVSIQNYTEFMVVTASVDWAPTGSPYVLSTILYRSQ
jgi:Tfp pilus assembly protein PilV